MPWLGDALVLLWVAALVGLGVLSAFGIRRIMIRRARPIGHRRRGSSPRS